MKQEIDNNKIKNSIKEKYGKRARSTRTMPCCGSSSAPTLSCCGTENINPLKNNAEQISKSIGYSKEELTSVPKNANLGLGCGNPTAHAAIKEGDIVLDLGSGGGFDCFLAAKKVGKTGKVIGVDMTPEMVILAQKNAIAGNYDNVEFKLGEIENLPVNDTSIDLIISNCVINLSPNKPRVFGEAFRVLKPKGKLMISDIVLLKELPEVVKSSIEAYIGCVAGAMLKSDYLQVIERVGFHDVKIISETEFTQVIEPTDPIVESFMKVYRLSLEEIGDIAKNIVSIKVEAMK